MITKDIVDMAVEQWQRDEAEKWLHENTVDMECYDPSGDDADYEYDMLTFRQHEALDALQEAFPNSVFTPELCELWIPSCTPEKLMEAVRGNPAVPSYLVLDAFYAVLSHGMKVEMDHPTLVGD